MHKIAYDCCVCLQFCFLLFISDAIKCILLTYNYTTGNQSLKETKVKQVYNGSRLSLIYCLSIQHHQITH